LRQLWFVDSDQCATLDVKQYTVAESKQDAEQEKALEL
jgi:hypothetical protein